MDALELIVRLRPWGRGNVPRTGVPWRSWPRRRRDARHRSTAPPRARDLLADAVVTIGMPSADEHGRGPARDRRRQLGAARSAHRRRNPPRSSRRGRRRTPDSWPGCSIARPSTAISRRPPVGGAGPDERAPMFDQQPIEAAAMADACARALAVTGDDRWQHASTWRSAGSSERTNSAADVGRCDLRWLRRIDTPRPESQRGGRIDARPHHHDAARGVAVGDFRTGTIRVQRCEVELVCIRPQSGSVTASPRAVRHWTGAVRRRTMTVEVPRHHRRGFGV